jgi:hypothetical protein
MGVLGDRAEVAVVVAAKRHDSPSGAAADPRIYDALAEGIERFASDLLDLAAPGNDPACLVHPLCDLVSSRA